MTSNQDAHCDNSIRTGDHCISGVRCPCLPAVLTTDYPQVKAINHHAVVARVRHAEQGHP